MATIALVGAGVIGERITRRLSTLRMPFELVEVDPRSARRLPADIDVVILAHGGPHAAVAEDFVSRGIAVVSVSDDLDDVRALLELDAHARANSTSIVVGAGMSPGLTGLLARMLASQLASCDEIHIAIHGTAGPACARQQHRALRGRAVGLHECAPIQAPAGSGRELCYFPEPVGAYDCYRGELPDPVLLAASFPEAIRISARVSANRRDRFTAWLPMLTPPHREGGVGAVRVEVRGVDADGGRVTIIAGVAELVATSTAATAIAFTSAVLSGALPDGITLAGDPGLDTIGLLSMIERAGVRLQAFTGVPSERRISANP